MGSIPSVLESPNSEFPSTVPAGDDRIASRAVVMHPEP